MKLIVSDEDFDAAILSITTCGKRLDSAIHRAAVSAAVHVALHGNPGRVNKLIAAMPKGSRVNALRDWFTNFGPVEWDAKTKTFATDKDHAKLMKSELDDGETIIPADVMEGVLKPWTECKPEGGYTPVDFTAMIVKAVVSAQKRQDELEGKTDKGDKIDPVLLAKIAKLVIAD